MTKKATVTLDREVFAQIMDLLDRHSHCQNLPDSYYSNCRECWGSDYGAEGHQANCPFYEVAHHPQVIKAREYQDD
jgi:hypothetical protein